MFVIRCSPKEDDDLNPFQIRRDQFSVSQTMEQWKREPQLSKTRNIQQRISHGYINTEVCSSYLNRWILIE